MVWMEPLLRPPPLPAALESMQHTAGAVGAGVREALAWVPKGAGWPPSSVTPRPQHKPGGP